MGRRRSLLENRLAQVAVQSIVPVLVAAARAFHVSLVCQWVPKVLRRTREIGVCMALRITSGSLDRNQLRAGAFVDHRLAYWRPGSTCLDHGFRLAYWTVHKEGQYEAQVKLICHAIFSGSSAGACAATWFMNSKDVPKSLSDTG